MGPEVVVRRPVYKQDDLDKVCNYSKPKRKSGKDVWKKFSCMSLIKQTIPIIDWLPNYDWKNEIFGDIVAGITVAVMHIPQGMAYAILGNVPPIVGIYMAFYPVLVYFFLGSSRHNSMGTFALVCMMTGKIVMTYSNPQEAMSRNATDGFADEKIYEPIQVAVAVTFSVAIIQAVMFVFRLGMVSLLLSDALISGFTTGAAIHVLTSQTFDIFGLQSMKKRKGAFKLFMTYFDIFNNIDKINVTAMVLSGIMMIVLLFNNEFLKPRISKLCSLPIPIEMIVVVSGTLLSTALNLKEVYEIAIVGEIPVGLPQPAFPPMELVPKVFLDSFVITMVAYTISISMAFILAQKAGYEVDANQELLAQGMGNFVGSIFSCMPITASLSRSMIQQTVGGRTQMASLVSCGILVCVLLWIGPFFEPLPRCILASIIVVALKGMFMQVAELPKFWRGSPADGAIWLITFLTVLCLDIEYGLAAGALLCLLRLFYLCLHPYTCKLALAPGTEIYLDENRYKGTMEIPGIKVFHYCGGLNFASRLHFKTQVHKVAGQTVAQRRSIINKKSQEEKIRVLILDFSALSHIDAAGAAALDGLVEEYSDDQIYVYVTGCSGPIYEMIRKCNVAETRESYFGVFPTVADAVKYAKYITGEQLPSPIWTADYGSIDDGQHQYNSRL